MAYEGAGPTLRDLSGRKNDGTIPSATTWSIDNGVTLSFPGQDGSGIPFDPIFGGARPASFSFYIRARANTSSREYRIFSYNTTGEFFGLLRLNAGANNEIQWLLYDGGNKTVSTTDYSVTNLLDIVGRFDNGTMSLFVQGANKGNLGISGLQAVATTGRHIAAARNNTKALNGNIAHTYIYSRALRASAIRQLHADPYAVFRTTKRYWAAILVEEGIIVEKEIRRKYGIVNDGIIVGSPIVKEKTWVH
jgi:hypothetical protein